VSAAGSVGSKERKVSTKIAERFHPCSFFVCSNGASASAMKKSSLYCSTAR
jgi:hypothetical protein